VETAEVPFLLDVKLEFAAEDRLWEGVRDRSFNGALDADAGGVASKVGLRVEVI